jgi:hypothetical protein
MQKEFFQHTIDCYMKRYNEMSAVFRTQNKKIMIFEEAYV